MPGFVQRVSEYIRRYGASYTLRHAAQKYYDLLTHRYHKVYQRIRAGSEELQRQRETPVDGGLISVVVPVYNTHPAMLLELAQSLVDQTYPDWEAILFDDCSPKNETQEALRRAEALDSRIRVFRGEKNQGISGSSNSAIALARGEWIALLDHDDLLTPDALWRMADTIVREQPDLIYSDEDKITENGAYHTDPHFKPDFCPDNLRSGNYICHLMVLRKSLIEKAGGFRSAFNGSQDHDLTLRCSELTDRISHVPHVLYQWRTVGSSVSHANLQKCIDSAAASVKEHMQRIGWPGEVEKELGMLRLRYDIKGDPLISVILTGQRTAACRSALEASSRQRVEWLEAEPNLNPYAAINRAAENARGDVLLIADASVLVQTPDFMTELLMYAQRDDVGAVTPALWNRHGRITHGGFALGMEGIAVCREQNLPRRAGGWHLLMRQSHNVSAVSPACLMIRKDHFRPFDERYTSALGAIDWCLQLQKQGLRHVFTPHAGAVCESRKLLLLDRRRDENDVQRFTRSHGESVYDPCFSLSFSRRRANGSLRSDL